MAKNKLHPGDRVQLRRKALRKRLLKHIEWCTVPSTGVLERDSLEELQVLLEAYVHHKPLVGAVTRYGAPEREFSRRYCVQVALDAITTTLFFYTEKELKLL